MIHLSPEATKILRRTIRGAKDEPDPLLSARSVTRSTTIVGLMLEDLGDKRKGWKSPGGMLARFGSIMWGFVELAAPHSLGEVLFQYWIVLAYALAVLMIVVGVLTTTEGVTQSGELILAVVFFAHVLVEQARHWMSIGRLNTFKRVVLVPVGLTAAVLLTAALILRENAPFGRASDEFWHVVFVIAFTFWLLSIGWVLATRFDRPYRAWIVVAVPTVITAIMELRGDSLWIAVGYSAPFPIGIAICVAILVILGLSVWSRNRKWASTLS